MYKGIIHKSRTFDVLAMMTIMTAIQPLLMDTLMQFNFSPKWVSLLNIIFIGILTYLRTKTTGLPGSVPPDGVERRGT